MALIGPNPSVNFVSSLVQSSSGSKLEEVLDEVLKFTDGSILTGLAANAVTRKKLSNFLSESKLAEVYEDLQNSSDPKFVALSWLADEEGEPMRSNILKLVSRSPMNTASLNVFTRLLAKSKLPLKDFKDDTVEQIMQWTTTDRPTSKSSAEQKKGGNAAGSVDDRERSILATLLVKALSQTHKECIFRYVELNLDKDGDVAFAVVRSAVDELPELADLIWNYELKGKPSSEFFQMLSVLCNSSANREKVLLKFKSIAQSEADAGSVIAAVVEAKLLASTTEQTGDIAEAASRLDKLSITLFEPKIDETSIEGLSCSAMLASVRTRLAEQSGGKKETVIFQIVQFLKSQPGTVGYAALAVLVHLSRYPMKRTKEEQQQTKLRIQSLGRSVFDSSTDVDIENENAKFHARQESAKICDQILKSSIFSWTTANATRLSYAAHEQLAYLLMEVCSHQDLKHRQNLALQGAVIVAMYLWTTDRPQRLSPETRAVAASSIAKILASVPPQIALTEKIDNKVIVKPLCAQIENTDSKRKNLDTFESLRALTNLSSLPDEGLKNTIAKQVWPRLKIALNCEFIQVRRASVELICNLMLVSSSAQVFLEQSSESSGLLSLLGRSILCDDPETRVAAAGSLAILAEWSTAASLIGHNNDCMDGICTSLGLFHEDDALLIRVLSALRTILEVCIAEKEDEVVEGLVYHEGVVHLEELEESLDPTSHAEVITLILKVVKIMAEYKLTQG